MILVNGVKFNDGEFHNGEVIFMKPVNTCKIENVIEMLFEDNRDITNLLFARTWLDKKYPNAACDLVMKYCPYERMDREINEQMFSMEVFADILGKFKFRRVYVLDPHSNVCVDVLKNANMSVEIIDLEKYINKVIDDFKPDYICYPDKGAYHKYPGVLANIKLPFFFGEKTRDLANKGKITDYQLVGAPDLKDKKVLIIDDICCLGGTAYNAAVEMKKLGAKEVAFYISHCENGIFAGKILKAETIYKCETVTGDTYTEDGKKSGDKTLEIRIPVGSRYIIDKVYTANTMLLENEHKNITVIE